MGRLFVGRPWEVLQFGDAGSCVDVGFVFSDQLIELLRVFCFFEIGTKLLVGQQAADARQGLDVWTGLIDGRGEQEDQLDGSAVDRAKLQWRGGEADGHSELINADRLSVGDGDAVSDAGGAGLFASPDGLFQCVAVGDELMVGEQVDQFFESALFGVGLQRHFDAVRLENRCQSHEASAGRFRAFWGLARETGEDTAERQQRQGDECLD